MGILELHELEAARVSGGFGVSDVEAGDVGTVSQEPGVPGKSYIFGFQAEGFGDTQTGKERDVKGDRGHVTEVYEVPGSGEDDVSGKRG